MHLRLLRRRRCHPRRGQTLQTLLQHVRIDDLGIGIKGVQLDKKNNGVTIECRNGQELQTLNAAIAEKSIYVTEVSKKRFPDFSLLLKDEPCVVDQKQNEFLPRDPKCIKYANHLKTKHNNIVVVMTVSPEAY